MASNSSHDDVKKQISPQELRNILSAHRLWLESRMEKGEPANVSETDLSGANLKRAELGLANLSGAKLSEADLSGAILVGADLTRADLSGADLSGANLSGANLSGAILGEAILSGANLFDAKMNATVLTNANLKSAVCGETLFCNTDLSQTKNLETITHKFPSTLGVDTLYRSTGEIPGEFLRGCGIPENLIKQLRSLAGAIQYYSCFISYTEADDTFCVKLYNDLQTLGVRCWRWREDAKGGRKLMGEVDTAVQIYDKLVLICSKSSLHAPAVLREIERALQKEDARKSEDDVLFPIRVDDYVLDGWNHHRKADVTCKNIGDFRDWNDPDKYKKALDRLIRDLQSGSAKQEEN